ncbi:MAG: c-type cytochrome [Burkholderiales bacterium]|nr:c-type cytochrome [Burkholderiales bacterium]
MAAIARGIASVVALALAAGVGTAESSPGDPARGYQLSESCASCHDGDGRTRYGLYPRIAGQTYPYLLAALKEFRNRERHQAFAFQMWDPVAPLSDQDLRDLAAYYSALPW